MVFNNNTTVNQEEDVDWANLVATYGGYVIALTAIPLNVLMLIVLRKKKKSSFHLLTSLVVADIVYALSFLTFSIRSVVIMRGPAVYEVQSFTCFVESLHLPLSEVGESAGSWTVFMLSLDRLICTSWPSSYRNLSGTYNRALVAFVWIYTAVDLLWSLISSYLLPETSRTQAFCWQSESVGHFYYRWHYWQLSLCGYTSVVFYIAAILIIAIRKVVRRFCHSQSSTVVVKSINAANDSLHKIQNKRDALITKRMAIVVVFTFLFQSVPMSLNLTLSEVDLSLFFAINPYLFILYAATCSLNIFVYLLCIPDVRESIVQVIKRADNYLRHKINTVSAQSFVNVRQTQ